MAIIGCWHIFNGFSYFLPPSKAKNRITTCTFTFNEQKLKHV